MLLTDKQTNSGKNITTLAEVKSILERSDQESFGYTRPDSNPTYKLGPFSEFGFQNCWSDT